MPHYPESGHCVPLSEPVAFMEDVEAWLELASSATAWPDGRIDVTLTAKNRAPRRVGRAIMSVICSETFTGTLLDIAPGQIGETTLNLPAGTDCTGYTVKLQEAGW